MTLWVAVVVASRGVTAHQARGLPRAREPARRRAHLSASPPCCRWPCSRPSSWCRRSSARAGRSCSTPGIVAVGVAVVLLLLRANFLVIVLAAGATAALLRASAGAGG